MRRLLLAVDETEASRRAAEFVERFFPKGEVSITAVNVAKGPIGWASQAGYAWAPPVPFGGVYGWPMIAPDDPALDRQEREALKVAAGQAPPGADVEVAFGDPAEAILNAADDKEADLIVVGSGDKGFLQRLFGGSVSDEVRRESPRPVLIVP